jgi:hypothetical protein
MSGSGLLETASGGRCRSPGRAGRVRSASGSQPHRVPYLVPARREGRPPTPGCASPRTSSMPPDNLNPLATVRSHRVRPRQAPGTPPGDAPRSSGQPAPLRRAPTDPYYPDATSHQHRHRGAGRRLAGQNATRSPHPFLQKGAHAPQPRPHRAANPPAGRTDDGSPDPRGLAAMQRPGDRQDTGHRRRPCHPGRRVPSAHRTAHGTDDPRSHTCTSWRSWSEPDGRSDQAPWQRRRNPRRCTPTLSAPRRPVAMSSSWASTRLTAPAQQASHVARRSR